VHGLQQHGSDPKGVAGASSQNTAAPNAKRLTGLYTKHFAELDAKLMQVSTIQAQAEQTEAEQSCRQAKTWAI